MSEEKDDILSPIPHQQQQQQQQQLEEEDGSSRSYQFIADNNGKRAVLGQLGGNDGLVGSTLKPDDKPVAKRVKDQEGSGGKRASGPAKKVFVAEVRSCFANSNVKANMQGAVQRFNECQSKIFNFDIAQDSPIGTIEISQTRPFTNKIIDITSSPSHFAFLLDNGFAVRIRVSECIKPCSLNLDNKSNTVKKFFICTCDQCCSLNERPLNNVNKAVEDIKQFFESESIDNSYLEECLVKNNNNKDKVIMDILGNFLNMKSSFMKNKESTGAQIDFNNLRNSLNSEENKNRNSSETSSLQYFIPPKNQRFVSFSSMLSKLVLLTDNGQLYSWYWDCSKKDEKIMCCDQNLFEMSLDSCKIVKFSSTLTSITLLTSSNFIARFFDETVSSYTGNFKMPLTSFALPGYNDKIVDVKASDYGSSVLTEQGHFYYLGPIVETNNLSTSMRRVTKIEPIQCNSIVIDVKAQKKGLVDSVGICLSKSGIPHICRVKEPSKSIKFSHFIVSNKALDILMDQSEENDYEVLWPINDVLFPDHYTVDLYRVLYINGSFAEVCPYFQNTTNRPCHFASDGQSYINSHGTKLIKLEDLETHVPSIHNRTIDSFDQKPPLFTFIQTHKSEMMLSWDVSVSDLYVLVKGQNNFYLHVISIARRRDTVYLFDEKGYNILNNSMHYGTKLTSLKQYGSNNLLLKIDKNLYIAVISNEPDDLISLLKISYSPNFMYHFGAILHKTNRSESNFPDYSYKYALLTLDAAPTLSHLLYDLSTIDKAVTIINSIESQYLKLSQNMTVNSVKLKRLDEKIKKICSEKFNNTRNLIHTCVSLCCKQLKIAIKYFHIENEYFNPSMQDSILSKNSTIYSAYYKFIKALTRSKAFKPYMHILLSEKTPKNLTPFAYAVHKRCYKIALQLMKCAMDLKLLTGISYLDILYNSVPIDHSHLTLPVSLSYFSCDSDLKFNTHKELLFSQLCYCLWNIKDRTCPLAFFDCHSCNIVLNEGICFECARTCHSKCKLSFKNRQFFFKCDCYLKSNCNSIHAGELESRFELVKLLVQEDPSLIAKTKIASYYIRLLFANEYFKTMTLDFPDNKPLMLRNDPFCSTKIKTNLFSEMIKYNERALVLMLSYEECFFSCFDLRMPMAKYSKSLFHQCLSTYITYNSKNSTMTIQEFVFLILNIKSLNVMKQVLKVISDSTKSRSKKKLICETKFIETTCELYCTFKYQTINQSNRNISIHMEHFFPKCYMVFLQYPVQSIKNILKNMTLTFSIISEKANLKLPLRKDKTLLLTKFLDANFALFCCDISLRPNLEEFNSENLYGPDSDPNEALASASTANNMIEPSNSLPQIDNMSNALLNIEVQSNGALSNGSNILDSNQNEARTELTSFSINFPHNSTHQSNASNSGFTNLARVGSNLTLNARNPTTFINNSLNNSDDDLLIPHANNIINLLPGQSNDHYREMPRQTPLRNNVTQIPPSPNQQVNYQFGSLSTQIDPFAFTNQVPIQLDNVMSDSGDIDSFELNGSDFLDQNHNENDVSNLDSKNKSAKNSMFKFAQFISAMNDEICSMLLTFHFMNFIQTNEDSRNTVLDEANLKSLKNELYLLFSSIINWLEIHLDACEKKIEEMRKQREALRAKKNLGLTSQISSIVDPELRREINDITSTYENLAFIYKMSSIMRTNSYTNFREFAINSKLAKVLLVLSSSCLTFVDALNLIERFQTFNLNGNSEDFFFNFENDLVPGYFPPAIFSTPIENHIPIISRPLSFNVKNQPSKFGMKPFESSIATKSGPTASFIKSKQNMINSLRIFARKYEKSFSFMFAKYETDAESLNKKFCYFYSNFSSKQSRLKSFINSILGRTKSANLAIITSRVASEMINLTYDALSHFTHSHSMSNSAKNGCLFKDLQPHIVLSVSFIDELAEGVGVIRSFFSDISKNLLLLKSLPTLPYRSSYFNDKLDLPFDESSNENNLISNYQIKEKLIEILSKIASVHSSAPFELVKSYIVSNFTLDPVSILEMLRNIDNLILYKNTEPHIFNLSNILQSSESFKLLPSESKLFWEPSTSNFYAPCPATISNSRCDFYMLVGKIIGIALRMNEVTNFSFCRHVRKYLLDQPIEWIDMAFYDATLFNNMSKLMQMYENGNKDEISSLELFFECHLSEEEGSGYVPLVENGSSIQVTIDNVKQYVMLYCKMKMITLVEPALYHMKRGMEMFVPSIALNEFSAEEFHYLLVGYQALKHNQIWRLIDFKDESQQSKETISLFHEWFKSILFSLDNNDLQDLLNFWTSVPTLKVDNDEKLTLITRPPSLDTLPTSNTCISRIHIPLYNSKELLHSKLMCAIKVKHFGFI